MSRFAMRWTATCAVFLLVNGAIAQLNTPVLRVLTQLLPPQDIRAGLLAVELQVAKDDATFGLAGVTLKLTAESPSDIDMTRYVAFLADRRTFVTAYLVNHELTQDAVAGPGHYRYVVEVLWRE